VPALDAVPAVPAVAAVAAVPAVAAAPAVSHGAHRRQRIRHGTLPASLPASLAATSVRTMLSASAIGVIILGAVPMAAAQASSSASPILAESIDGSSAPLSSPAPPITLADEHGRPVSLAGLRGKAVLLTFLDPVCVTQCPIEAQEFKQADALLGADASKIEMVAVNLNPLYSSTAYTTAFDRAEGLGAVRNWLFLTGRPAQLQPVWRAYGQAAQTLPAGSMLGHSDSAFVIDPSGRMREELNFDPGPGTAATESSFATELAAAARQALGAR
jgi:cytochrome oxidase Cu insertion factor (SCO1/SenC/PrrC family)